MNTPLFGFALETDDFARDGNGADASRDDRVRLRSNPCRSTPESGSESQPLQTMELTLAYEGRIDNRREVADALGQPALAEAADGVVFAAAYRHWGPGLVARLIGEFAFVIVDWSQHRIVAGQDAIGIRRLWYRQRGSKVWITSNLALLFELFPDSKPGFDGDVLAEYFSGLLTPRSGRTVWRGVRELQRGNVLTCTSTTTETAAWRPDGSQRLRFRSPSDVDDAFRSVLFQAVRGALRASGPTLCDLSGGFDSSSVASVAALVNQSHRCCPEVIAWSTVSSRSANERAFQLDVSATHRIQLHQLRIEDHLPFQVLEPGPLPHGGFLQTGAMYRAMRTLACARGVQVRITGHGPDALLQKGVQAPIYLNEWLRERRFSDWLTHFGAYLRQGAFSFWQLMRECSAGTLDPLAGQVRNPPPRWLTRGFISRINELNEAFHTTRDRAFDSDARERLWRFTLAFVPPQHLMLPDERMPLLYRPLLEFLLALDWKDAIEPGATRPVMKRALRGILPDSIRHGHADAQHGSAMYEGLIKAWPLVRRLVVDGHLASLGVVDKVLFDQALTRLRAGYDSQHHQFIFTALYLEVWLSLQDGACADRLKGGAAA